MTETGQMLVLVFKNISMKKVTKMSSRSEITNLKINRKLKKYFENTCSTTLF